MRRLLVTGGAGFIGSHFVRSVLQADANTEVVNLDALTYSGVRATVDELDQWPRHEFVHGDIRDPETVRKAIAGVDAVVHFAAESHVDRSISGPQVFVDTNVGGTAVLLQAAIEQGVERFLHVSTDEVYGSLATGSAADDAPLKPSSPYSASKAGSDLLALSYHTTFGLDVVVTRCTNNYGPYQFPEKVIPLFVTNLLDGRDVPLYGDGRNERDWLHVEDHCSALRLVLDQGDAGQVYNIGANTQLSNLELTMVILAEMDAPESRIRRIDDRLGHDLRYAVDSSRVRALGWRPQQPFREHLAETIGWYRQHRDWWEPLRERMAA